MARKIVHQDDVYTAAEQMASTGEKPTVLRVYEALGRRGSYTTISKYLQMWEEDRQSGNDEEPVAAVPLHLSEQFETLIQQLWKAASSLAVKGLEKERADLKEQEAELRTEMRQVLDLADGHVDRIDELEDELRENLKELQHERAASQKLIAESQVLQQNLALKNAALERALSDVEKLETKLEALTEKYEAKSAEVSELNKQIALLQAQNKGLQSDLAQAKADTTTAREALSTVEIALGEQKNQNATLIERINHLQGTNSDLTKKLESQQEKAERLAELNGKLSGQLDEKDLQAQQLEKQLSSLQTELAAAKKQDNKKT